MFLTCILGKLISLISFQTFEFNFVQNLFLLVFLRYEKWPQSFNWHMGLADSIHNKTFVLLYAGKIMRTMRPHYLERARTKVSVGDLCDKVTILA